MTPKGNESDLPVIIQESQEEAWDKWTAVGSGAPNTTILGPQWAGISSFEGSLHYCHYPYHCLALGQNTRREHSPIYQQKTVLKIYFARPH